MLKLSNSKDYYFGTTDQEVFLCHGARGSLLRVTGIKNTKTVLSTSGLSGSIPILLTDLAILSVNAYYLFVKK